MTTRHFTAWLVNDPSCLDQPNIDLTVLEDALIGDDPDNEASWSTDNRKPTALYAITSVDAVDGDIDEALSEAEDLMREAGWQVAGQWDAVPNAYVVTVERNQD